MVLSSSKLLIRKQLLQGLAAVRKNSNYYNGLTTTTTNSSLISSSSSSSGRFSLFSSLAATDIPKSAPLSSPRRTRTRAPKLLKEKNPTIIMDDTITDIEDLHQHALSMCSKTYIDPATGFTVFTELQHLKRGFCCGNKCRHCPYGFANVKNTNIQPRPAKLKSGDMETAQRMMQEIMEHGRTVTHATTTESSSASTASTVTATTTSSTSRSSSPTTTTKNVPYTRTGDSGTSQLLSGERRSKDDANFEALGSVDELCTFVGVAHAHLNPDEDYGKLPDYLLDVMSRLFDAGSHVAKPQSQLNEFSNPNGVGDGFDARHIDDLEVWINEMTEELPELTSFILPTGAAAAAHLHVARTVCRRAERRCVTLVVDHQTCDPNALKYLNRLSDFLFTASRWVNYCEGEGEYLYRRDTPKSTQRQRVARSLQHEE